MEIKVPFCMTDQVNFIRFDPETAIYRCEKRMTVGQISKVMYLLNQVSRRLPSSVHKTDRNMGDKSGR